MVSKVVRREQIEQEQPRQNRRRNYMPDAVESQCHVKTTFELTGFP